MKRFLALFLVVSAAAACTKKNPEFCTSAADCMDPAKPFCDVNGQFGTLMNDCIAAPPVDAGNPVDARGHDAGPDAAPDAAPDAFVEPVDAPPAGCTAGSAIACSNDSLTTCGSDGHTTAVSACSLGCATSGATRCLTFTPSNGLGSALAAAASEPDVAIPRGSTINTDTGAVLDSSSAAVAVTTLVVTPASGPKIRVLIGHSFSIDDVRVSGGDALAIVAAGEIHIVGRIDASARGTTPGPGAETGSAACVGGTATHSNQCDVDECGAGAGGGGHGTAGGQGGEFGGPGGAAGSTFAGAGLAGGCAGGAVLLQSGTQTLPHGAGGGGGGGVQLVSSASVLLDTAGVINVGGGGGLAPDTGGGAGGTILIEAPVLTVKGPNSGLVANGGGGGGCGVSGPDGGFTAAAIAAPSCSPMSAGNGGVEAASAQSGEECTSGSCPHGTYGGGGGAVGTLHIATRDGGFSVVTNPVISASVSESTLVTK